MSRYYDNTKYEETPGTATATASIYKGGGTTAGVNIGIVQAGRRHGGWFTREQALKVAADVLAEAGEHDLADHVRRSALPAVKVGDFVRLDKHVELPAWKGQLAKVVEVVPGGARLTVKDSKQRLHYGRSRFVGPLKVQVTTTEVWTEVND